MANYKENTISLGYSDIASLVVVGYIPGKGADAHMLSLGGDGSYKGYVITDYELVPEHYKKAYECNHWLKIYDDEHLVYSVEADHIAIYRAGDYGILILVENRK